MAAEAVLRSPRRFHPLRWRRSTGSPTTRWPSPFAVPPELRETYRHAPGQHLALRRTGGRRGDPPHVLDLRPGPGPRRGPSRCGSGVRLVEGGEFSTYALKELAVGRRVSR